MREQRVRAKRGPSEQNLMQEPKETERSERDQGLAAVLREQRGRAKRGPSAQKPM